MSLTVFTPTYNRAYILPELYDSLKRQTSSDFEWLIIDDGSTDDTKMLVEGWIAEDIVRIRYVYKENGGMHTAHNTAYGLIETELNVCIDSDDLMTDDGVEKIIKFWNENRSNKYGGIYALDVDKKGNIIGEKFPEDLKSFQGWGCKIIYYGENKKVRIKGDKKFISVTKVLNEYPSIPVFGEEKYYSLYYKQHFIERDYSILILNEPVCVVEYLQDGSSNNMFKQYVNNPKGFKHMRKLMMEMAPSFTLKFTQGIHYVNSCLILKQYNIWRNVTNKIMITFAYPFGVCLFLLTIYKNRQIMKNKSK